MLSGADLKDAISGCRILICNDYELELIKNKTGKSCADLLCLAQNVIVTLGGEGSKIYSQDDESKIPAAPRLRWWTPPEPATPIAADCFRAWPGD